MNIEFYNTACCSQYFTETNKSLESGFEISLARQREITSVQKVDNTEVCINGQEFLIGDKAKEAALLILEENGAMGGVDINDVAAVYGNLVFIAPKTNILNKEPLLVNEVQVVSWARKTLENFCSTSSGRFVLSKLAEVPLLKIHMYDVENGVKMQREGYEYSNYKRSYTDGIENIHWVYNKGTVLNYCVQGKAKTTFSPDEVLFHEIIHCLDGEGEQKFLEDYFSSTDLEVDFNNDYIPDNKQIDYALAYHFDGDLNAKFLPQIMITANPKTEAMATYFEKLYQHERGRKTFYREYYTETLYNKKNIYKAYFPSSQFGEILVIR